jgi:hypothetical protein
MCTAFYELAFEDQVLKRFMFDDDGASAHGKRLSDWIAEKMGEPGMRWTRTRPPHSRQRSHHQAWNSKKREPHKRGEHFKLDDCRVWMRLMFLAGRNTGLAAFAQFWDWYVRFIGHFVRVYERTAPAFASEAAAWGTDEGAVKAYMEGERLMADVVDVTFGDIMGALPARHR